MKERLLRYKRKINFITEKLERIPEQPQGLLIDAALYAVQVAVDAAMDIIAMLVKDSGENVSDDYHNIDILVEKKILSVKTGGLLRRYNGLRNAIVHKYNKFEEREVTEHITEIRQNFERFLDEAEHEIGKITEGKAAGDKKRSGTPGKV